MPRKLRRDKVRSQSGPKRRDIFDRTPWQIAQQKREENEFNRSYDMISVIPPDTLFAGSKLWGRLYDAALERSRLVIIWETWIVAIRYFDNENAAKAYAMSYKRVMEDSWGYGYAARTIMEQAMRGVESVLKLKPYSDHLISRASLGFPMSLMAHSLSPFGDFDWPFEGTGLTLAEHMLEAQARKNGIIRTVPGRTRKLSLHEENL
jgi:hypothetical protein